MATIKGATTAVREAFKKGETRAATTTTVTTTKVGAAKIKKVTETMAVMCMAGVSKEANLN
jgi:hypothetical protein